METNDQIMPWGEGKFQHCKSENFPQPWWKTLENKTEPVY